MPVNVIIDQTAFISLPILMDVSDVQLNSSKRRMNG